MPAPLAALEAQRDGILREIAQLGDMRKGSITEAFRSCGKPGCACHRRDHPGHGPYYAYTMKVAGKTWTVQLRAGARLEKFHREVDTCKEFRALSDKLVPVNSDAARATPTSRCRRAGGTGGLRARARDRLRGASDEGAGPRGLAVGLLGPQTVLMLLLRRHLPPEEP